MKSADSAQFATVFGTIGGWILANYSTALGALCALTGTAYTLWKWHREIKKAARDDRPLD